MIRWFLRLWRRWVEFACWEPEWPRTEALVRARQPLLECLGIVEDDDAAIRR